MSIVVIVAVMVFAAGLSYRYVAGRCCSLAARAVLRLIVCSPYRRRRLLAFLDPWADPLGDGFQIIQSLIAVGTGGVFGRGLMAGVQKLFYLPEPHTDFIYAVIAEELGLDRHDRRAGVLLRDRLARLRDRAARARSLRRRSWRSASRR